MFTRVKMSTKEEIHRGVDASVVQTGRGNKRKSACFKEIKEAVSKILC